MVPMYHAAALALRLAAGLALLAVAAAGVVFAVAVGSDEGVGDGLGSLAVFAPIVVVAAVVGAGMVVSALSDGWERLTSHP